MEKTKRKIGVKIAVTVIAILLFSSTLMILASSTGVSTVSAQSGSVISDRVNPITGKVYGDLSQYDWPRSSFSFSQGDTPAMAKSSGGPAPNTWNVLWSMAESAYQGGYEAGSPQNRISDLGHVTRGIPDMLMGGWILVRSTKGTVTGYTSPSMFDPGGAPIFGAGDRVDYVNALDPYTGNLVYQLRNPSQSAPAQVDDKHFRLTQSVTGEGTRWMVYEAKTGQWKYNVTTVPSGTIIPESKIIVSTVSGTNTTTQNIRAYDISGIEAGNVNVTARGELWRTQVQRSVSSMCAGDGVLFYGSWYDNEIFALNARNGTIMWRKLTNAVTRDALYYNGKLYTSALKRDITTYNGTTGEKIWTWQGGVRTYFSNTGCAGDGLFFDKAVDTPAGFVGCWDDATGELRWKIPGYYYIGYFSTFYDDGKVYAILQDARGLTEAELSTAKGIKALSACIDAMTGQILWTVPFQIGHDIGAGAGSFRGDVAIAYGCLFVEYYNVLYCVSDIQPPKDWANYRGNVMQNAVDKSERGAAPADVRYPKWSFQTGGYVSATPAVANGKVFAGSQDGQIYCLDAYTGDKIWNFTTKWRVLASCAYSGGRVYTGADDGNLYCLDADDGSVVWSKDIGGKWEGSLEWFTASTNDPASSPIIVGDRLYVGAKDGKVLCVNTANGNILWSYQTYGPILGSPCYYNNTIFITSTDLNYASNGGLYSLDATSGTLKWHVTVGGGRTGMASTPCIVESIKSNTSFTNAQELGPVLLVGQGGTTGIYSYNITTGVRNRFWTSAGYNATNWQVTSIATTLAGTPFTWTPAFYNNTVYGAGGLTAAAWNYTDGKVLWSQWLTHNVFVSPLVSTKGWRMDDTYVYYGADSGAFTCLNALKGTPISAHEALGLGGCSPALWEGKLYVGNGNGMLYCFANNPSIPLTIYANPDKGAQMWSNETITLSGRLHATENWTVAAAPELGVFSEIVEMYYPGIPTATVKVTFVKPDSSSVDVTTTTNSSGFFTVQFNPNVVGKWSWVAWYDGKEFPAHSYSYDKAYTEYTPLEVVSPPSSSVSPTPTPTPTPAGGTPVEYIYAAVAVVAIILIVAAVLLLRRRSKK